MFIYFCNQIGPPQDGNETIIGPTPRDDGTCGGGWVCEHRWRQIYNMIGFRNVVKDSLIRNWWSNGDQQIAFCRGELGFVAFTNYGNIAQKLQTCLPTGIYCDVISGGVGNEGSCNGKTITVGTNGFGYISLAESEEDGVLAIHIKSKLN